MEQTRFNPLMDGEQLNIVEDKAKQFKGFNPLMDGEQRFVEGNISVNTERFNPLMDGVKPIDFENEEC